MVIKSLFNFKEKRRKIFNYKEKIITYCNLY